jgi:hypothetical protein
MRARLFTTLPERQRARRARRGGPNRSGARQTPDGATERVRPTRDLAVERAQHAGGPLDAASYTCQCGYLFVAPVSTTVSCPHCGCSQAW